MFRTLLGTMGAAALALLLLVGTVAAYTFPSTNDENRANGLPHVNLNSTGVGTVTLDFVNDTNSLTFFEVRLDGESPSEGNAHPVVTGDVIHPGVSVEGRGIDVPVIVTETFSATSTVEVRLALGGERDWDFDWTLFPVGQLTREDCQADFASYDFANLGQCIRFVNTGQDSR